MNHLLEAADVSNQPDASQPESGNIILPIIGRETNNQQNQQHFIVFEIIVGIVIVCKDGRPMRREERMEFFN